MDETSWHGFAGEQACAVDDATFATISMKLCSNFQIEQGKYNFDTRRGRATNLAVRAEVGASRRDFE